MSRKEGAVFDINSLFERELQARNEDLRWEAALRSDAFAITAQTIPVDNQAT